MPASDVRDKNLQVQNYSQSYMNKSRIQTISTTTLYVFSLSFTGQFAKYPGTKAYCFKTIATDIL